LEDAEMPFWVDIAPAVTQTATAAAISVSLARGNLFLLLESSSPDLPGESQALQAVLGPVVSTLLSSPAASPSRTLDIAFEAANRTFHELKLGNPALEGMLVSATAGYSIDGMLHVASVGSNGALLRSGGSTRQLVAPETAANKLMNVGITADPLPSDSESSFEPVNGLGLAPELFCVRQTCSIEEPGSYLLLLCGGRVFEFITPAHVDTISPAGGDSRTARRLYDQFAPRLSADSVLLAAHKGQTGLDAHSLPDGFVVDDLEGQGPGLLKVLFTLTIVAALLVACALLWMRFHDKKRPTLPSIPSPTLLLPSKDGDVTSAPVLRPVEPELQTPASPPEQAAAPLDRDIETPGNQPTTPDAAAQSSAADSPSDDSASDRKRKLKRKRKRKSRKERKRRKHADKGRKHSGRSEANDKETAENTDEQLAAPEPAREEPTPPETGPDEDNVQVMDFTRPEPEEEGEDEPSVPEPADTAQTPPAENKVQVMDFTTTGPDLAEPDEPEKRPFPAVKLEPGETNEPR